MMARTQRAISTPAGSTRKPGSESVRRPWSEPDPRPPAGESKALIAGRLGAWSVPTGDQSIPLQLPVSLLCVVGSFLIMRLTWAGSQGGTAHDATDEFVVLGLDPGLFLSVPDRLWRWGGNQSPTHLTVASPFAGEWHGDWTDSIGHHGTIRTVVGRDGDMAASLKDDLMDVLGAGEGRVQNDGQFLLWSRSWDTTTTLQGTGTLVQNGDSTARTTMVSTQNGHRTAVAYVELRKISD